jgi:hypothetical protein
MAIMRGMTQLRNLELGNIQTIDGSGFAMLQGCKYLERIDFANCRGVGDKSLLLLKNLKTLQEVVAGGSSVTEQGAQALKKFIPDCKVGAGQ